MLKILLVLPEVGGNMTTLAQGQILFENVLIWRLHGQSPTKPQYTLCRTFENNIEVPLVENVFSPNDQKSASAVDTLALYRT